jgi:hypothetical protein
MAYDSSAKVHDLPAIDSGSCSYLEPALGLEAFAFLVNARRRLRNLLAYVGFLQPRVLIATQWNLWT